MINDIMSELKNTIPEPSTISEDIDNEIKALIIEKIRSHSLDFHTMTDFFQQQISASDKMRAQICGYYVVNVILSNRDFTRDRKIELINSICSELILLMNPHAALESSEPLEHF